MTTKIVKSSESTTRIPRVSHLTSSTGELADSIVRCWLMTSDLEQPIEPGSKQIGDLCELIDGGLAAPLRVFSGATRPRSRVFASLSRDAGALWTLTILWREETSNES